jgi:hypothetical protein
LEAKTHLLLFCGKVSLRGDGLRSVGVDDLPSSKSVCSLLPIARHLRGACVLREEKSMREHQAVSEMADEVLGRQAKALADRSGRSLGDALEVVANTEAGRQLRELANGEHGHEKARDWQVGVLWERAEGREMHLIASDALSRFAAEGRHYSWVEGYMEWLEGKEERAEYHALLEEELASLRG